MPLFDLPMSILFLLFLWLFILIGFYPAWKRAAAKFRRLREARGKRQKGGPGVAAMPAEDSAARPSRQLDDFEIIILRRLAQGDGKGLSRRRLIAELHLEPPVVSQALRTLQMRELVVEVRVLPFGTHFMLSRKGHEFAVAQGFIPSILEV
ncbi:hypothetical protein EDC39_104158 [Geothermobacter ehrlichii]|uniref:Uncharacterized protein n=1 Tax=Geothermobacter ehrlichii TaxID=213224 RepID=A0A5D3WLM0_9BACT|nr:hypothetical protein [Geothermobacter ehrlichii]TYO99034.1 hypothetical protein EDC39_104158 [Geothermobacter ehrlichii]